MNVRLPLTGLAIVAFFNSFASDPTATEYSYTQCDGSFMPYQAPEKQLEIPDSLTPVFINHVGRHGARYPSSPKYVQGIQEMLHKADSLGTIPPLGRELMDMKEFVLEEGHNK
ncbi:MAG: hypothetical protein K2G40_06555, partial [Muribaculaceae bacterium]|nr:hypothetical protein [Muribaculaceae bacterium]